MKRLSKKQWRWLIVCLVLIGGVVAVARYLSTPSTGTIRVGQPIESNQGQSDDTAATTIESDYYQLSLPISYKPQSVQPVPGLLHSRTLIKPSASGSLVVNIGIKAMPEGGLDGDPSFRLRQQKPDRYHLSTQTTGGDVIHIANDAQSAAVVAFWPHGGYLATISISSGLDNPSADENAAELKALQPLLAGWQWR